MPKQWDTTAVPLGSGVINFMQMNWDSAQLMIVPFSILITGHNPPYPQKCKLWGPVFQLVLWWHCLTGRGIIPDCQKIVGVSTTVFFTTENHLLIGFNLDSYLKMLPLWWKLHWKMNNNVHSHGSIQDLKKTVAKTRGLRNRLVE